MKKALGNAAQVSKGLGIKSIKELSDEWIELTKLKKNDQSKQSKTS